MKVLVALALLAGTSTAADPSTRRAGATKKPSAGDPSSRRAAGAAKNPSARLRGRAAPSRRRRLADGLDMPRLAAEAKHGHLGATLKFKLDGTTPSGLSTDNRAAAVAASIGCDPRPRRVFRAAGKHEAAHVAAGLNLWYDVSCAVGTSDKAAASTKTLGALQTFLDSGDHDGVAYVGPELAHATSWAPNDPQYGSQTHYDAIDMKGAWDVTTGGKDVVVQVLDSGLDLTHEDFKLNIWTNPGEICGNGVDDDDNGFVDDCHGYNHADDHGGADMSGDGSHGTHCSGTIAADSNNGVGVAGVAGGDGTADSGVKLMTSVGFGKYSIGGFAEALVYGADNGAHVSSNSWGYLSPGMADQAELDAIDYINSKNGIVVFAAGNDDSDADWYPAYYDGAVAVAATDDRGDRAGFTNYGTWIDISAPGVDVLSTYTVNEGSYGYMSGTSMACPHVAGVLALGKSVDASSTRAEILACAHSTATDVDSGNSGYAGKLGSGIIDAAAFVACVAKGAGSAAPTVSPAPTPKATPRPTPRPTAPLPPCKCDNILKLDLTTDDAPAETTWTFSGSEDMPHNCEEASGSGGPYYENNQRFEEVVSSRLCDGQTYTFELKDSWGDGICCGYGAGKYDLFLNGAKIKSGGEFTDTETVSITVPRGDGDDNGDDTGDDEPVAGCGERWTEEECGAPGATCCWEAGMCYAGDSCGDGDDAFVATATPTSAPTAAPTSAPCEDSPSWYRKKPKKNCDWVANRPDKRCKRKGVGKEKASEACPVACDSC